MINEKNIKGLYLASKNMDACKAHEHGIYKKIMAQYAVFERHYEMCLISCGWKCDITHKILARLPFFPSDFGVPVKLAPKGIDFLFFRFDLGDRQTIRFLKRVRSINPKCKIIVEVPTYPLAWPTLKWYTQIIKPKHRYCENRLHLFADRVAYYGPDTALYGLPVLGMSNGIDLKSVPLREIREYDDDGIDILSVSAMSPCHAIDRMIDGIGQYLQKGGSRRVTLHVVGEGHETRRCKELTDYYQIHENVIFYGYQVGEALRKIENMCDIGLEMLGGYRVANNYSSTIKSREYWAKGMPIITSAVYPDEIKEIASCVFQCPNDSSPVDVEALVRFFDEIFDGGKWKSKRGKALFIRDFVRRHYDMEKAMEKIIQYIDESSDTSQ